MSDITKETNRSKYSNLETQINSNKSMFGDYGGIKRAVILADAIAHRTLIPKPINVGSVLRLNQTGMEELANLYSDVINPIHLELFKIRSEIIGTREDLGLGRNIKPPVIQSDKRKDELISEFSGFFTKLVDTELKDSQNIKAVIIYPLIISVISVWKKTDYKFSNKLIESLMNNEKDEKLRIAIKLIDLPPPS